MAAQNEHESFQAPFQAVVQGVVFQEVQEAGVAPAPARENQPLIELMPASTRSKKDFVLNGQQHRGIDVIERVVDIIRFLEKDLSVPRLNDIHDELWVAGRPMPPRPLHYQLAASRAITLTEDIHLHLVWEPGRIFLKPLPRYLLSSDFWTKHLVCPQVEDTRSCPCFRPNPEPGNPVAQQASCGRREMYKCAYGLLLSFTALIQYESDYNIATDHHLIPNGVKWQSWRELSQELLEHSPYNTARVNKRYQFGELRVGRLNKIYRIRGLLAAAGGLDDFMRGYKFEFATYGQQLEAYLAPILAATAYILLVLTAMQVGLGTDTLRESLPFQNASYGFTVFSILGPLTLAAVVAVTVVLFAIFNYQSTKAFFRRRMAFYRGLGH
ncbi:subtilisin-like serine protease [Fusarium albosuccineum]|uniref:Subtilisin-like serine protease n=1 Tax=Fusarium albosuccineum TaxID=1237068 RepID=A0A8H4LLX4_9HYPO|nr:subtilisin-like serine protease [Fusarium albosuccineum]